MNSRQNQQNSDQNPRKSAQPGIRVTVLREQYQRGEQDERRETSFSMNRTEQYALYMRSAASPVTAAKSVTANIERIRGGSV